MKLDDHQRSQYLHEIDWCLRKIAALRMIEMYQPSVAREIADLIRQIQEKQVSLAFNGFAHRCN